MKGAILVMFALLFPLINGHTLLLPAIGLCVLSAKWCNMYISIFVASWNLAMAAVIEVLLGSRVIINGDVATCLKNDRPTVIILNHRTRFDWMFLYSYLARFGDLKNHRITLKTSLKHIPLYGYILQLIPYIFLNRKWDSDKQTISNMLNHYCNVNRIPVQLLLFPEGTDLSERNKQRDRDYAIVNNLPVNTYTMHPRTTGFIHCMKTLRNEWGNGKVNICDITIGYLGVIPQSEKDLLKGTLPKEVHYHVKHYPSSSLPSSDEELSDWLKERWVEKEERLANFYQSHSFPGPIFQDGWRTKALMIAAFIKWLVLCGTAIYTLFNAPVLTIGSIAIPVIISFIVDKWMDGWDTIMTRH